LQSSVHHCSDVSIEETLASGRGIVDLWYWFYEGMDDADLVAAHEAIMTADEREQYVSFHFERDRLLFLATRALVRTVLSRYAPVAPPDWRFAARGHGRPRVTQPVVTPRVHFNLANTPGLVVCAVSVAHKRLGVDVERIDRKIDAIGLAEHNFSRSEVRALRALPASDQTGRFFALWTLKESYSKARGLGLALPLDQFSFLVNDDQIGAAFDPRLADDPMSWRFALLDVPPKHIIALSVQTGGTPLSLRATAIVPLKEKRNVDR
jgi:4'-phosphopantetheinyl transferase